MRFETPKMNEEEEHSMHIPGSFEMQCDACTAVAYQVKILHLQERNNIRLLFLNNFSIVYTVYCFSLIVLSLCLTFLCFRSIQS